MQTSEGEGPLRPSSRGEGKAGAQSSKTQSHIQDRSKTAKPPSIRRDTSDIFKSFAKTKPKLKRGDTDNSTADSVRLLFDFFTSDELIVVQAEPSGGEDCMLL